MELTLRLYILYLSGNNLQLFPNTSSYDVFFKLRRRVFTARYALSLYLRMLFVFKGLIRKSHPHSSPETLYNFSACIKLCVLRRNTTECGVSECDCEAPKTGKAMTRKRVKKCHIRKRYALNISSNKFCRCSSQSLSHPLNWITQLVSW
jgi:hypothetical protein